MPAGIHYVYSLSSEPRILLQQTVRSVRSLLLSTNPDPAKIHLFMTPPIDSEDVDLLEGMGLTVHIEDTEFPGGFRTRLGNPTGGYAEKWKLTKVDADTVVFLDGDTIVLQDLTEVVEGEFQFKARPLIANDQNLWKGVFEKYNETPRDWYPNAGFLVFKHGYHKQLKSEWKRYIRSEIPYYVEGYTKEQFALALASCGCDFEPMTRKEHVMEWLGEIPPDGYVHHLADESISVSQEFLNAIDGHLPAKLQTMLKSRYVDYYDKISQSE